MVASASGKPVRPKTTRVVEDLSDNRRIVQRFAVKADKGYFDRDDLDVPQMLFAYGRAERKLAASGLLFDKDLALDELAERSGEALHYVMEEVLNEDLIAAMAETIAVRIARERSGPKAGDGRTAAFVESFASGARTEKSERELAQKEARAARTAAVHLAQRAFYLGLSRAFLKLALDQANLVEGRLCGHAQLRFVKDAEAIADKAIERHRRRLDLEAMDL